MLSIHACSLVCPDLVLRPVQTLINVIHHLPLRVFAVSTIKAGCAIVSHIAVVPALVNLTFLDLLPFPEGPCTQNNSKGFGLKAVPI